MVNMRVTMNKKSYFLPNGEGKRGERGPTPKILRGPVDTHHFIFDFLDQALGKCGEQ